MQPYKEFTKNSLLTKSELKEVEKYADSIFKALNIDIEFTKHFAERANDIRNKEQIKKSELIAIFKELRQQYGTQLTKMNSDNEAVINDINSNINIPFIIKWNEREQEFDLINKTIMRKKDFKTRNKKLVVQTKPEKEIQLQHIQNVLKGKLDK